MWWIANWLERASHLIAEHGVPGAYFVRVKGVMALSTFLESGWPNPRPFATAGVVAAIAWGIWLAATDARPRASRGARRPDGARLLHARGGRADEHHIVLAVPLLAVAAAIDPRFRALFILVTVIAALGMNMFYGIGRGIGWAVPRGITGIDASVVNAFANVAAFVWFVLLVSATHTPGPMSHAGTAGASAPRRSHRR